MLHFSKLKIVAILIFCALAICFSLPSFLFHDQSILNEVFKGYFTQLDNRMNWKPYWNVGSDPIVVHFHGPKPLDFDPISLNPLFRFDDSHIYYRLLKLGDLGYRHYLKQWLSLAHDSFA